MISPSAKQFVQDVFQSLNREVWIITAATADQRGGLLATWIMQVSLDTEQPCLIAGLAPNHFTTRLIEQSGKFAAHLLKDDQAELALSFAIGSGRDRDKLADVSVRQEPAGPPILIDCRAWLNCKVYARLVTGDRIYFWADVLEGDLITPRTPSLCAQQLILEANESQQNALRKNLQEDRDHLAPHQAMWRKQLPEELVFRPS